MNLFRKNKKIIKSYSENKNFSYSKGEITLQFTLRTDIKTELKDFNELLTVAQRDIEDEINK